MSNILLHSAKKHDFWPGSAPATTTCQNGKHNIACHHSSSSRGMNICTEVRVMFEPPDALFPMVRGVSKPCKTYSSCSWIILQNFVGWSKAEQPNSGCSVTSCGFTAGSQNMGHWCPTTLSFGANLTIKICLFLRWVTMPKLVTLGQMLWVYRHTQKSSPYNLLLNSHQWFKLML